MSLKMPQAWTLVLLASVAQASEAPQPAPVAGVQIPAAPGALGSVVANGRTVQIRHVYAKAIEEDHPFRGRETLTVLLLSDRALDPSSFGEDVWKYTGQSLEYEGVALRVDKDGAMRTLLLKHKDVPYQESGQTRMEEFVRAGAVVSGRQAGNGMFDGKTPWSYAVAFKTKLLPSAAKRRSP